MRDFIAMGGYGFYIWTSYALTFFVLAINIIISRVKRRQILNELSNFHQTQAPVKDE
ncbi:MAG: heme exporter protein D [Cycloclasticus sp.]|jgi:heme exporter protein D|tara:strand:- start:3100 stop:3270 length:171 start_codon:yes stop_codon:yes gene_type:complete